MHGWNLVFILWRISESGCLRMSEQFNWYETKIPDLRKQNSWGEEDLEA